MHSEVKTSPSPQIQSLFICPPMKQICSVDAHKHLLFFYYLFLCSPPRVWDSALASVTAARLRRCTGVRKTLFLTRLQMFRCDWKAKARGCRKRQSAGWRMVPPRRWIKSCACAIFPRQIDSFGMISLIHWLATERMTVWGVGAVRSAGPLVDDVRARLLFFSLPHLP